MLQFPLKLNYSGSKTVLKFKFYFFFLLGAKEKRIVFLSEERPRKGSEELKIILGCKAIAEKQRALQGNHRKFCSGWS